MLLAIDTATNRSSIALHDGQTLRGEFSWESVNRHTVTLAPHINNLLAELGTSPAELSAIAVCKGPGSYTGVRIGVALAKGMALTQQLPLIGITTLDILVAAQPPDPRPLYAILAVGRKRIGYARYRYQDADGWQAETKLDIVEWAQLPGRIREPAIVVGEISTQGLALLATLKEQVQVPAPAYHLRRAGFLAELAWVKLRAGQVGAPALLVPLYAR
ncbi:MAG TPA: tRNA (adenosine(37)-N6)-threonylcarbamoyltransferase complex dimerization subunit type 1 TsaB [Thermoflexia bacterium]|nr:tRNA (adenosine(37)-N6)-threonylcarbamoyltransferase complex dimerization subunit type 1 TsaB [Thermoflexia bacterium]